MWFCSAAADVAVAAQIQSVYICCAGILHTLKKLDILDIDFVYYSKLISFFYNYYGILLNKLYQAILFFLYCLIQYVNIFLISNI